MERFQNLYELEKTVRFELKPSKNTLQKIKQEKLFDSPVFQSRIFIKNQEEEIQAKKKVKNYQFCINFTEFQNLINQCDEKIKKAIEIKNYLEKNPTILWSVWIDPEKIKIIDKDLKYQLQEKKSWKKEFWNESKRSQKKGRGGMNSSYTVEWKKGSLFTLDDIDAYFERIRSTKNQPGQTGKFTLKVLEKLSFLLNQYEIRRRQLLIESGDAQNLSFLKKKELIARIRSFLAIFLKIENTLSLFVPGYETERAKFDKDLKEKLDSYNKNLSEIIKEVETIFKESDLYLHKNIQRRFSFNIRAINPNPEGADKMENQNITESSTSA